MKKLVVATILLSFTFPLSATFVDSSENKITELIDSVDENSLYYYDKTIQDFGPHPTGSEECNKVANFIFNEFSNYGLETEYQEWDYRGVRGKNVIATLYGLSLIHI